MGAWAAAHFCDEETVENESSEGKHDVEPGEGAREEAVKLGGVYDLTSRLLCEVTTETKLVSLFGRELDPAVLQNGDLRLTHNSRSHNQADQHTRSLLSELGEKERRQEELELLERQLRTTMDRAQQGDPTELGAEIARLLTLKSHHIKRIAELQRPVITVNFQVTTTALSIVLKPGTITKLSWGSQLVVWCPSPAESVKRHVVDHTTDLPRVKTAAAELTSAPIDAVRVGAARDVDPVVGRPEPLLDCTNDLAVREALDRLVVELRTKHSTVYELLNRLGRNRDGLLSREEMRLGIAQLVVRLSTTELDSVMRAFDEDGSGKVDYVELYTVLSRHRVEAASCSHGFVVLFSRRSMILEFDRRTFANLSAAESQYLIDKYQAVATQLDQVDVRLSAVDREYLPPHLQCHPIDGLVFSSQEEANTAARQVLELAIAKVSKGSVGLIPCEASVASAEAEYTLEFRLPKLDKTAGEPLLSAGGLATYTARVPFFSTHYSTGVFNVVVSELSCRVVTQEATNTLLSQQTRQIHADVPFGFGGALVDTRHADPNADRSPSRDRTSRWAHLHRQT